MERKPRTFPVLVVEDDPEQRALLELRIRQMGYPVESAAGLGAARLRLASACYAILLIDQRLEDGDGLDLLAFPTPRPRPVPIVLTAHPSLSAAIGALQRGAYDYLLKPFPEEALQAVVRRAAERFALEADLLERSVQLERANAMMRERVVAATQEISRLNRRLKDHVVRLARRHREQGESLRRVTHELSNPLGIIQGYVELLEEHPASAAPGCPLPRGLAAIRHSAETLRRLIDDLADAARIETGKLTLFPELLLADAAAVEVVDAFRREAQARGIRLDLKGPARGNIAVLADRVRLRWVNFWRRDRDGRVIPGL